MNTQPRIDHLALTIERVLMRGLETGRGEDAAKIAAQMRIELEALRDQQAWTNRETAWTYPKQPRWAN